MPSPEKPASFEQLGLPTSLQKATKTLGYETPSPIQRETIPLILSGHDVLGHAPTGTGKTAAFALPLLANIDNKSKDVQVLVLTPTRELTIQVAEAFQSYSAFIKGVHVLPIYGGQAYVGQISQLRRGVQTVVGTPGRVMDHLRKGTLKLDNLKALVLDEADEMLRMGFIDDVEWILEQIPEQRQIALFSATMPKEIEKIAKKHLREPRQVTIKSKTATAATIRQRYWPVTNRNKLEALTRILEVEHYEALIIFVRTKVASTELTDKLAARGHAVAAINGDMQQKQREQTIAKLKKGTLDILVATDVAARGLDVDRISHVLNYDIPYDTEAYIHRIGRTGRAGRQGDAILFVTPREKRMLGDIERATRQPIEMLELPSIGMVNDKRVADFKEKISNTIAEGELEFFKQLFESYQLESDASPIEIAAAAAKLLVGRPSLLMPEGKAENLLADLGTDKSKANNKGKRSKKRESKAQAEAPEGLERYRIEVGHDHDVKPSNIVGAIANEAGLDAQYIGHIDIYSAYSTVDLPVGMPRDVFRGLKKVWVCGRQLNITHLTEQMAQEIAGNEPGQPRTKSGDGKKPSSRSGSGKPRSKSKSKTKFASRSKPKKKDNADSSKPRKHKAKTK